MYRLFALFLLFPICIGAQTELRGSVGDLTLDSAGNPFLVTENVTVPSGKKLRINPGCALLFKPFTGIIVEGSIEAIGTSKNPVYFTSENDSQFNNAANQSAKAFDWNGIRITGGANGVYFANVVVSYSVFGIKSEFGKSGIENGLFYNNGQFNATINDRILPVLEGIPFSINVREKNTEVKTNSGGFLRKGVPVILVTSGLVTSFYCGFSVVKWNDAKNRYRTETGITGRKIIKKNGTTQLVRAVVSGTISAITVGTGVILLLRNGTESHSSDGISLMPTVDNDYSGLFIVLKF